MSSAFAAVLMWVNAFFIVFATMAAYQDAVRRNLREAKQHLQLAGLLALFSALMCSAVLYEKKADAAPATGSVGPSWNAYPTASR
jgi:amino acid transporter